MFPSFEVFFKASINGVLMGWIFAVIAYGFQLVFGVVKLPQFAHGSFVLWGMYLTWYICEKFGFDVYLALIVILPLFFVLGYLTQKFIISAVMDIEEEMQMIFLLGMLTATMYTAEMVFTVNPRFLGCIAYLREPIDIRGLCLHRGLCISVLISVAFMVGLSLFLNKSRLGTGIRACADNRFGAQVTGLNVPFLYKVAVAIATLAAGLAGTLLITFSVAAPWRAFDLSIYAFLVTVLGGMGSYLGTVAGGLVLGLLISWSQASAFSTYSEAIVFAIMFVFLLVRPSGLFGKRASAR